MSHDKTNIDRIAGTFKQWHGLNEIVARIARFLNNPLSEWDIQKQAMREPDGSPSEWCRLVATDNPAIRIGSPVHCDTYGVVSNADFLDTVFSAIEEIKGAEVQSVGSVCGRSRIFLSVSLAQMPSFEVADREFKTYLNFLSSHDQSAPFIVNTSNICTVCNNTFSANLTVGGKDVFAKLKHSKNVKRRLENVPDIVDGFLGAQARFRDTLKAMANQPIRFDDAAPLFVGYLSERSDKEVSTRRMNQANRMVELFARGAGNRGENMADAFNAVTDYYSHESSGGDDNRMKQYLSSEYGAGAVAKQRAFDLFSDDKATSEAIDFGRHLIAASA